MKNSLGRSIGGGSMWSRLSLAAAVAAAVTLGMAVPAGATGTPDAQMSAIGPNDPTLSGYQAMAQTFKALNPGQLSEVDLHYGTPWWATGQKIQVWTVEAGVPATMASSISVTGTFAFTPAWHPFPLTTKVQVQAGHEYAIVATATVIGSIRWSYNPSAGYSDGQMLARAGSAWLPFGLPNGSAFAFKTFVEAAPAAGLHVGADRSAATAPEGTAPTMTGTYSGNVGNVTLSSDQGSVQPGPNAGTWTWTGGQYDEGAAPSSATVTVTDTTGASASSTFPLQITAVKPKASIGTSPNQAAALTSSLSMPEGSTLTLYGSATTPNTTDQAAGFAYAWSVSKDGGAFSTGTGATLSLSIADEGTYVVTMTARDDGGMVSDPASATVVAGEFRPVATIMSISPSDSTLTIITPQETLNFAGSYRDPAPESHSFRWDFGDGTSSASLFASHAYAAAGTYPVTLTVTDDEAVSGSASTTVVVETAQQALAAMVSQVRGISSLNAGQQNSLIAKLNAASDAEARGDNQAAHNELNAFLNELDADLKAGKITAAAFNSLRADAHAIEAALGTFNRFVDWWPLTA